MEQITWDNWIEKYKPLTDEDGQPRMYETYGADAEFVKSQPEDKIWTLQAEDGEFIQSGWHFVNRIGYYITENPFKDYVYVDLEEDEWEEDESRYD